MQYRLKRPLADVSGAVKDDASYKMDWVQIIADFVGNLVCHVCFTNNVDVAFGCGHLICQECCNRILMNPHEDYLVPRFRGAMFAAILSR